MATIFEPLHYISILISLQQSIGPVHCHIFTYKMVPYKLVPSFVNWFSHLYTGSLVCKLVLVMHITQIPPTCSINNKNSPIFSMLFDYWNQSKLDVFFLCLIVCFADHNDLNVKRHDITEMLLKLELNTNQSISTIKQYSYCHYSNVVISRAGYF
jgi:hypothetical protein